jgi:hypothetical protein
MSQAEQQYNGKRWTFPAEVEDLLSRSVLIDGEILFLESPNDLPRSLAEHGDIEHDQIGVQLHRPLRRASLGLLRREITLTPAS